MLKTLEIRDFALIERLQIDWTAGLNVLTGETGAGKSIIIDALNALLGGKAGQSLIRSGAEKSYVEGCFSLNSGATAWLKKNELIDENPDSLTISREISRSGSRSRVNGILVNQSLVQELSALLITIHAQHEARTLLSSSLQLEMLDSLGDQPYRKILDRVLTLALRRRDLALQLKELAISEEERLSRLDFMRFQANELNEARLIEANEDEDLSQQQRVLANVAQLGDLVGRSWELLQGESDVEGEGSACDLLQSALGEMEKAARLDPSLQKTCDLIAESQTMADEAASSLRRYKGTLDEDPERLGEVGARLALLASMKRKYGPTLKDAISKRIYIEGELTKLESAQAMADDLESELSEVKESLDALCIDLSQKRQKLAAKLSDAVQKQLAELGMERCKFQIRFEGLAEPSTVGIDKVDFLIAPNPGQPLMPLAKIASGGELSRIMLAIKTIFAAFDQVATVIFDEIDTGLSGRVVQAVRDKLARLARSHQILLITHQPIIAAVAGNHIQVYKEQSDKTTRVFAGKLDQDERLKALAAMASGQENEEVALNFARSLIDQASQL